MALAEPVLQTLFLALLLGGMRGRDGLAVLAGVPVIGLFRLVYGWIGLRMDRMRAGMDRADAEVLDCLIVNGLFQSPGLASTAALTGISCEDVFCANVDNSSLIDYISLSIQ